MKRIYFHLFLLILVWGLSWPVSKVGLKYMHPLTYTSWRFGIALFGVTIFLLVKHRFVLPKTRDLPFILSIGLLQMALFVVLLNFGLLYVQAGRAALLVYSTPVWVTPIAVMFFKEALSFKKVLGLICGVLGLVVLLDPFSLFLADTNVILGYLMLVAASVVWAAVILHTRYGKWHSNPLDLLLWQILLACVVLVILAFRYPVPDSPDWNLTLVASLLYNGLFATAYAYFASILVAKSLPTVSTSTAFLLVPIVGLLASVIFLRESLSLNLLLGMALVMAGLFLMAVKRKRI